MMVRHSPETQRRARHGKVKTVPGSQAAPFIVVTGLSGAGKSHALRALEDLGYYCVDNLPIALIPTFADLILAARGPERRRAAVVVDVREGRTLARFPGVYRRLKQRVGTRIRLVFLEARDAAILRRFSETRRPHPLGVDQSLAEGIGEERRLLEPIRRLADQVVDTTSLTVHELRRRILESTGAESVTPLVVTVVSFGFRRGVPADSDLVFDVRFLPNPNFVPSLKRWTGRQPRVARYIMRSAAARRFLRLTTGLLRFLLPQYIAEGKTYLTIAIGCTGGRHRSVAIAEALVRPLKQVRGIVVRVRHRDVLEERPA
jgi:RNase adapter protein RapZ